MHTGPDGSEDDSVYIACNFHWETRTLALPDLPGGRRWKKVIDTSAVKENGFLHEDSETYKKKLEIAPLNHRSASGRTGGE